MSDRQYRNHREPAWDLEPHYHRHVSAMTEEKLHAKADIAEELAVRDRRIEQQAARIAELEGELATTNMVLGEAYAANETLKAERDVVLSAIVAQLRRSDGQYITEEWLAWHGYNPGNLESLKAALLAAHREGEGR